MMNNWRVRSELSVLQNAAMAIGTQEAMVGAQIVIMRAAMHAAATSIEAEHYSAGVAALENRAAGMALARKIIETLVTGEEF